MLQAARTGPVRAPFIFLDLLKRQSEPFTELFLAHSEHQTTHTHTRTDILVRGVWRLFCHRHRLDWFELRLELETSGLEMGNKEKLRRSKVQRSLAGLSLKPISSFVRRYLTNERLEINENARAALGAARAFDDVGRSKDPP